MLGLRLFANVSHQQNGELLGGNVRYIVSGKVVIMDMVRKERLKLIESISSTISDSVARTNDLARRLGWDGEIEKVYMPRGLRQAAENGNYTQDFSQNIDVHTNFKQDLLFFTFETKESKALHTHTPWTYWSAHTRSCRELPYSAVWGLLRLHGVCMYSHPVGYNKEKSYFEKQRNKQKFLCMNLIAYIQS